MSAVARDEERALRRVRGVARSLPGLALAGALILGLSACRRDEVPRTFRSPEEAIEALDAALAADDDAAVEVLFGAGSLEHLRSGDPVADREDIERVRKLIAEAVTFEDFDERTKVANFGKDPWPFAFPLVSADGRWRFDLEGGIEELHNRRVGRNELFTLASLHAYVDAQREYWMAKPMGVPARFAQKFRSDEGTRDGLYWPTAEGEEPSPLGELVAQAESEGYHLTPSDSGDADSGESATDDEQAEGGEASGGDPGAEDDEPRAYHGYRFRILTGQSESAAPGEGSYLDSEGRMRYGFAAVAWPVSYGNSGIMTFIINQRGIAFEKDLGPETATAVQAITSYHPDETWLPTGD